MLHPMYPVFRSPQTGSVYTRVTPGEAIFAAVRYVPGDQQVDGVKQAFRVRIQVAEGQEDLLGLALNKLRGINYCGPSWVSRSGIHMSIVVPLEKVYRAVADAAETVMEIIRAECLPTPELPTTTAPELLPVIGGGLFVSGGHFVAEETPEEALDETPDEAPEEVPAEQGDVQSQDAQEDTVDTEEIIDDLMAIVAKLQK